MGEMIKITAADGFQLSAYQSVPKGESKGALIILQEIFGLTDYIKSRVDAFANEGYHCIAPGLMDRAEPGVIYSAEQSSLARETMLNLDKQKVMADIEATFNHLSHPKGVAILGYCWGGLLCFLAARKLNSVCNIAYYGGRTQDNLEQLPSSAFQFHFGDQDSHIPMQAIEQIRQAMPAAELYTYPCGHAFDNDTRASFSAEASALARQRSLEFLKHNFARHNKNYG